MSEQQTYLAPDVVPRLAATHFALPMSPALKKVMANPTSSGDPKDYQ